MRTTLTLDDDVSAKLRQVAQQEGRSFKEIVNDYIRKGMTVQEVSRGKKKKIRITPHKSAFLPGVDLLKLNQLADDLEVDDFIAEAKRS